MANRAALPPTGRWRQGGSGATQHARGFDKWGGGAHGGGGNGSGAAARRGKASWQPQTRFSFDEDDENEPATLVRSQSVMESLSSKGKDALPSVHMAYRRPAMDHFEAGEVMGGGLMGTTSLMDLRKPLAPALPAVSSPPGHTQTQTAPTSPRGTAHHGAFRAGDVVDGIVHRVAVATLENEVRELRGKLASLEATTLAIATSLDERVGREQSKNEVLSTTMRLTTRARKLNAATDAAIEEAIREHEDVAETLVNRLIPLAMRYLGADGGLVRTSEATLVSGTPLPIDVDLLCGQVEALHRVSKMGDRQSSSSDSSEDDSKAMVVRIAQQNATVLGQPIDVAGDFFGTVAFFWPARLRREQMDENAFLMDVWVEEVDNHLASVRHLRLKHSIARKMTASVSVPSLDDGVIGAVETVLGQVVGLDAFLIHVQFEETASRATQLLLVWAGRQLRYDGRTGIFAGDAAASAYLETEFNCNVAGETDGGVVSARLAAGLPEVFGACATCERMPIGTTSNVVGHIVTGGRALSTFDREIVEQLADCIAQRASTYVSDWSRLRLHFAPSVSRELLQRDDYRSLLAPAQRRTVIMFADLCSFSRLAEQVLVTPQAITELVEHWSTRCIDIVWRSGGVLDSVAGDCIIAFWGPPFFRDSEADCAVRALQAARDIIAVTKTVSGELQRLLAGENLAVSIGLNACNNNIGIFGATKRYTALSGGMNVAARLQGLAGSDEILCTAEMAEQALGTAFHFGDAQVASVKNMANEVRYRALLAEE